MSKPCVMIMAGGTGGHVFPALSLAGELQGRGCEVVWLGTRAGIEARLVPAAGIPVEWIDIGGLRGKGMTTLLAAPWRLARALRQALAAVRRHQPRVVVGLGGYVTGPGGMAAWLSRRPLVIHEQNAVAGFTNRVLARFARCVLEAFAGSFGVGVRAVTVGNPVRRDFFDLPPPAERMAKRDAALRVLVVGGSQGAERLNKVVPAAIARALAAAATTGFAIRHQSGVRTLAATQRAYAELGIEAEVSAFIDDIAAAYGAADLVICRAGALTVCELAAAGVASILVPFAAAVDDHQTRNARHLVERGAAVLIAERDLDVERLGAEIARLAADRATLLSMAEHARTLARPQAARELAEACLAAGGLGSGSVATGAAA
ncbi:MAG: undecaprenyldiphospho-muramoylpentapeptide beta-N-acetylglucosaminyltransferase [Gammaproteobacteria bacterium]|nr:undecaprenyldiphospho-muramoylpentapeptide beta-N-acetylglucosaminyltransferase [Gammaproteobacteria bacterium]